MVMEYSVRDSIRSGSLVISSDSLRNRIEMGKRKGTLVSKMLKTDVSFLTYPEVYKFKKKEEK